MGTSGGTPINRKRRRRPPKATDWARYEQLKAAWIDSNQLASPAEYTAAMQDIARRAGV